MQSAPGTASDVKIFIGPEDVLVEVVEGVLASAAYPILNTSPDETTASMRNSIFCIYFRVGM